MGHYTSHLHFYRTLNKRQSFISEVNMSVLHFLVAADYLQCKHFELSMNIDRRTYCFWDRSLISNE